MVENNIRYTPEAICQLRSDKFRNIWVVPSCPICGQRHVHNAGIEDINNPMDFLGMVNAQCISSESDLKYILKFDGVGKPQIRPE